MAEMKIGFVTFNPGSGDGDQAVTVSGENTKVVYSVRYK